MWLAHESPPKNFTGVDVTDIKNPKIIVQTDLPHQNVRSNSLEVCGDLLVVAYQTTALGLKPAGIDIFDISDPENPNQSGSLIAPDRDRAACTAFGLWTGSISTAQVLTATWTLVNLRKITKFTKLSMSRTRLGQKK